MALLAHVLQLVAGFLGPLIIFLIKRESKFVKFHALQALFLHIAYMLAMGALFGIVFFTLLASIPWPTVHKPPVLFLSMFGSLWLGLIAGWMLMLVMALVWGIRAGRGEWAEYPIVGRWAKKLIA